MKNLITFLLYCLSVTALIAQAKSESTLQILDTKITETTLRLELDGFDQTPVVTPQGTAIIPDIQGGTRMLQKGAPDLPKFSTALLIPNKGNMIVEVVNAAYEEYAEMEIAPSKGNLLRTVNPDELPFEFGEPYTQDAFFPGKLAKLQSPFILRQTRGQAVWIYPLQYNPVKKVLRVYHTITLRVKYIGGTGKNELTGGPIANESQAFQQIYQQLFANYKIPVSERNGIQEPDKMLVIADDDLLEELEPLIIWKRQMGIHTTVVPVSEIGSSEPAEVYNFVRDYYAEHGISYLLLVGDENAIKPQLRASGAMYSCDNCFGYISGDDHFPEILVGRLHASSPEQMRIMVNRNLEYEINPLIDSTQNWMATGLAAASNQGAGVGDDNQADWEHGNEWKIKHLADGFEQYWEFYDGDHSVDSPTPGDSTADKAGNPSNIPIVNLMNSRGVSLYNYTGHGWEQGLVSGNFTNNAVGNLTNSGRYPILIAVACCAGNFTNGECLGEAWQRAGNPATGEPYGGIAGFFSSDYQSWSPPMEGQDGMNQYLVDADGIALTPSLGGMLAFGNALMIAAYGGGGEAMADFWNPFAEPSTVPRTAMPQILTASHVNTTDFGNTSLMVTCPVEGALVSLFWENQTWAVARVENGVANLEFSPLNNIEDLTVTVTQFNYIPYQGKVTVKPLDLLPYVINLQTILNDSNGNNNQRADFGEAVGLNLLLKNIGLGMAADLEATISTTNPYVNITSSQGSLGDLDGGASTQVSFAFQVSDAVPNGSKVNFSLLLNFNDSLQYETTIPITLFAPALEVGAWSINDDLQGNGNGRLESGEVATLSLINKNTGGSDLLSAVGTLTALSPYISVGAAQNFGPLGAGIGEQVSTFTLSVAADAPISFSTSFQYELRSANGNYVATKNIEPVIVNAIIEPFETGDFNNFNWQLSGNKPWQVTTANTYAGQYCARSGTITHNQNSTMELSLLVMEDGLVSFAVAVSSEADFDFLRFYIDNQEMGAWSGERPWEEVTFPVSAGLHMLRWVYKKDDLLSEGTDRAWVDEIILPPHQVVVGTNSTEKRALQISVLPNPTDGRFQLQFNLPTEQVLSIRIFDGLGRLVQTVQTATPNAAGLVSKMIDLQGAEPGIYLVQVQGEFGGETVKVVVY